MLMGFSVPEVSSRDELVAYLRANLIGPCGGDAEQLRELPYRRYLMGTLYPQEAAYGVPTIDDHEDATGGSTRDEVADDPLVLANEWLPSSLGVSVFLDGVPEVNVCATVATYSTVGRSQWQRDPDVVFETRMTPPSLPARSRSETNLEFAGGRAAIRATWRPFGDGWLATFTVVNTRTQSDGDGAQIDPEDCLYQVRIKLSSPADTLAEYPRADASLHDPEEDELAMLYRRDKVFAIGHGCAADWCTGANGLEVFSSLMPEYDLQGLTFELEGDDSVLDLHFLADQAIETADLQASLRAFVDRYDEWIRTLRNSNEDLAPWMEEAASRNLARLRMTADRMRSGIDALDDPSIRQSFALTHQAMLMQMCHSSEALGGTRRSVADAIKPTADYGAQARRWRPFQLAFLLLVLPGLADDEHEDREIVDLLWFSTGGGKTESYLAAAAFSMIHRRLTLGSRGGGTAVITRYTLRLLTTQQFQRAATLICALDVIRREESAPPSLNQGPFSIGLWLGDEVTPNRWSKALDLVQGMLEDPEPRNPFQLETCPWCGTEIIPTVGSEDSQDFGVRATSTSFEFFCPNQQCEFHEELPVVVVDEELFKRPPTFLLGTVDKFARLAWEEGAGNLFGSGTTAPPSLIIQDELHLLSGPLGTLTGLYERAIDNLIRLRGGAPKIIAATATIRRADEQVRRLFAREVAIFPPAGLSADNSYFSRTDKESLGRRYVGVMAQSHTATTTTVQVASSLLLAPGELALPEPESDAYWTLVAYHNTLRELGRSVTNFRDDVPEMMRARAKDSATARVLDAESVVELTGNVSGHQLPKILERLGLSSDDPEGVGVLATTNMLSVGVDIPRLGLMLVHGQPKTAAEYIQATSRVGRSDVPGLVVAMLSATKPRDRSHYEGFRGFHQSLYRHVEPTSVTPFALPARERALHAVLVILVRHAAGLSSNDAATGFDPELPAIRRVTEALKDSILRSDPDDGPAACADVERLVQDWADRAKTESNARRRLFYNSGSKTHASLLKNFGATGEGWETPQSMRNVDRQCLVWIPGARP